jgi:hypothetical protein
VIMSMAELAANYLPTYVKENKFLGVEMAKSFQILHPELFGFWQVVSLQRVWFSRRPVNQQVYCNNFSLHRAWFPRQPRKSTGLLQQFFFPEGLALQAINTQRTKIEKCNM